MRYLVVLGLLLIISTDLRAAGEAPAESNSSPTEEVSRLNLFGMPREPITELDASEEPASESAALSKAPACDSPLLFEQVHREILSYQKQETAANTYERRRNLLTAKNLSGFSERQVEFFTPSENYNVADRVIDLKMNQRLSEADMKLCVGTNRVLNKNIYLLIYPKQEDLLVEIINFKNPAPGESSSLSFVYQD